MTKRYAYAAIALIPCLGFGCAPAALAQDHSGHAGHDMQPPPPAEEQPMAHEGMDHSQMDYTQMADDPANAEIALCGHANRAEWGAGSGTARLPGFEWGPEYSCGRATPSHAPGLHVMSGDWMLMAHGAVSLQYTDHKGPRGDEKVYATSMAMLMAERRTAWGGIQFKSMLSLEPAMDAAGYPNLFATGETAGGLPLVDRQHPHDLFMELAARVDVNAGGGAIYLYGGPVGEPALGPSAFMHRGSASNNPEPPITHHWFDSTHITYGVVTLGYAAPTWQIEASAFRGAEPDERRWNIETPKLDSWSVRATFNPSPRWAVQASYGEIKEPEATHPGENENRFTASAHYGDGRISAMLAYSAKKRVPGDTLSAWLGEVNWDIDPKNSLFARIENVKNDELFPDHVDPLHDTAFRVTKFQAGYARHVPVGPFDLALGGSVNAYAKPAALDAAYGRKPWGYTVFARVSLGN